MLEWNSVLRQVTGEVEGNSREVAESDWSLKAWTQGQWSF